MGDGTTAAKARTRLTDEVVSTALRTDVPHPARMYDYYLGGKDNFQADREAADQVIAVSPAVLITARELRSFMVRSTRHLITATGVRQFLDIGTGIPTSPNLHEVAQLSAPESRVVYVDNDPIVLAHARALLTSSAPGATAYLDADLHEPDRILGADELRSTIDLGRPVALSLLAILHFLPDDHDPFSIVTRLVDALPSGSYLSITHATGDFATAEVAEQIHENYRRRGIPFQLRRREEILRFFAGLDLVEPGLVPIHRWWPEEGAEKLADADTAAYGGLARKP